MIQPIEMPVIDVKKSRFSDAPWFERAKKDNAIVGGIGNIGSWVSLFLARQGVTLHIYDFDNVDAVNLASQLYSISSIGSSKYNSLVGTLENYVDSYISDSGKISLLGKLTKDNSMVSNICFSCFDNMEARKLLFENWYNVYKDHKEAIFIDGRLLAEIGQVFFVTPDRADQYRATLFEDSEVAPENCSYKGTTHCSAIIAGLMVSGYNNFLCNLDHSDIRDLPFNINYQLPLLNFQINDIK